MPRLATLLLLAGLGACGRASTPAASVPGAADTAGLAEALLAADRAFGDSTAARGLEGWMRFYAEDAVRLTMGAEVAQGLDAVRAHDASLFADSAVRLVWTPLRSGVFADGRHGFTTGRSAMLKLGGATPDTVYRGAYVTIWRREADGRWKVILDTGS
jgi:ketosteroid isomerase-like protein